MMPDLTDKQIQEAIFEGYCPRQNCGDKLYEFNCDNGGKEFFCPSCGWSYKTGPDEQPELAYVG